MARYRVTIDSAFEGGASTSVVVDTTDPRNKYEGLVDAAGIASFYAGEYCDGGSVIVVNVRDRSDRAVVARRLVR